MAFVTDPQPVSSEGSREFLLIIIGFLPSRGARSRAALGLGVAMSLAIHCARVSGFRRLGLAGPDLRYVAIHLAGRSERPFAGRYLDRGRVRRRAG